MWQRCRPARLWFRQEEETKSKQSTGQGGGPGSDTSGSRNQHSNDKKTTLGMSNGREKDTVTTEQGIHLLLHTDVFSGSKSRRRLSRKQERSPRRNTDKFHALIKIIICISKMQGQ
jgi:hypothetical protein